MAWPVVKARTPTLALGSEPVCHSARRIRPAGVKSRRSGQGFTLIELIVVVALVAIAAGVVSLSLRDGASSRLEQDAMRLAALLESARAEARASGLAVRWLPTPDASGAQFRFVGLPPTPPWPNRWLDANVSGEVPNTGAVVLGPEPMIGAQRIVLRLAEKKLELRTDGLGPFAIADEAAP